MFHAVRQIDRRDPLHPSTLVDLMPRAVDPAFALRAVHRSRQAVMPVDLNSIDSPASKPHLFAVGGSDTWLRVYDRRMAAGHGSVKVRFPSSMLHCAGAGLAFHQLRPCFRAPVRRAVSMARTSIGDVSRYVCNASAQTTVRYNNVHGHCG